MNRLEALALVIAPMPPGYAREIVRAALKGWSVEDVAAWHRLKDNERKQAKRDALRDVRLSAPQETGQVPPDLEGDDRTSSGSLHGSKPDPSPSPQVSPTPPSSPTPTPVLPPAHTHARPPTVDEVIGFLRGAITPIAPADRADFAQSYIDARDRTHPPWTLPANDARHAVTINLEKWQADCRTFAKNWKKNDDERAAKLRKGSGYNGNSKTRKPQDTNPLVPGG